MTQSPNPIGAQTAAAIELHLRPLTRRSLFLGAAAGGLWLAGCRGDSAGKSAAEAAGLDATERQLLAKLVEVFLPTENTTLTSVAALPLMENITQVFGMLPPKVRSDFGMGLRLFEWGPWVIGFHFSRFSKLAAADARAYCEAWQSGNTIQRGVFGALKQIVYMSYWREPATWPPIGYEGPVTARYGIPRLGNAPLPID